MILDEIKAESLLAGSHILEFVKKLVHDLTYTSEGGVISYEDMYAKVTEEVDRLPRISLSLDVSPGTEGQYSIQLLMAMERVADECDRVSRLIGKFESKVREAAAEIKRQHGEFSAWYTLAAMERIELSSAHLPTAQVQKLANSEFSRLTDGLDITMDSLLNATKLLKNEIKEHKKTQSDKYSYGKDQVNASWTSHMPLFNGNGDITEKPGRLLEPKSLIEEETETGEIQDFVPQETKEPKGFRKFGDPRPVRPVMDE